MIPFVKPPPNPIIFVFHAAVLHRACVFVRRVYMRLCISRSRNKNRVCESLFLLFLLAPPNTNAMRSEAPARSSSNSQCLVTSIAVYCEWQMVIYVGLGSFYFIISSSPRFIESSKELSTAGKRCLCGEDHFLKANRWLVRRVIEWTRRSGGEAEDELLLYSAIEIIEMAWFYGRAFVSS